MIFLSISSRHLDLELEALANVGVPVDEHLDDQLVAGGEQGVGDVVRGHAADPDGVLLRAGVGEARFAFLILLFIFVGKFRSQGLLEIPSIAGFFTYQIASLRQGLKEYND